MNDRLEKAIRENYTLATGIYFGYPLCCIKAFAGTGTMRTQERYPEGKWLGTGFIPCLKCAEKIGDNFDEFVQNTINPNRVAPMPFPYQLGAQTYHQRIADAIMEAIANKPNQGVVP